jgi:hypothetical protein
MAANRRTQLLAGLLLVVLGVMLYRAFTTTSAGPLPASNGRADPASNARAGNQPAAAPEVHLRALGGEHPKPVKEERNLFRFKPKPPPPPVAALPRPGSTASSLSPEASGPPPLPPINLKFIGILERNGKPKIAVLTDGIGPPLYGQEGTTVAGRYKILRIGAESIEMSYLDGRGRQTIRLTGGS